MATDTQDEFKFPDEIDAAPESDDTKLEVEVVDDTPEEDRGRTPMPKPLVEELEKDELDAYDDNVKIKLKQMRKVWHDERREKEAVIREHEEAVALTQRLMAENAKIKQLLSTGEKEYVTSMQNSAQLELDAAKRAYKEAYDAGDSDGVVEAQQALQEANFKLLRAKNFRLPSLQTQEDVVQPRVEQTPAVQAAPAPDPKAVAWQKRNSWFGSDRGMTAFALGLHQELTESGVRVGSDEYYAELDKTVRRRFPEVFSDAADKTDNPRPKPKTVVAPAMRSTSSNKVRLNASQVQLAKKLGITPEAYAKEFVKLENQNG